MITLGRRTVLGALALGILATAPVRVHAATEAEASGYGGSSVGSWGCGPIARANYGGGGARVRYAQEAAPFGGKGAVAEVAGAVERESSKIVGCDRNDCAPSDYVAPKDTTMIGAHVRGGYQWDVVGVEGGATVYQAYDRADDPRPSYGLFPDLQAAIGHPEKGRGVLGLGSPTISTLRRPGVYVGIEMPIGPVAFTGLLGSYRSGPGLSDDHNARADVIAEIPLSDHLAVKVGGSASGNKRGNGGEGTAGILGKF